MALTTTRLHASHEVARGTRAFEIDKPAGFAFKPGQAFEIILPGPGEGEDTRHAFSIVSAPHEPRLMFATRMRDSVYKRHLGALQPGARIDVDGPFGSLTLHKKPERAGVLIAGGIGITPFMSMLRHAAHVRSTQPLALLYSNRRPEDTAFLAELQQLAQAHPQLHLHATMTDMAQSQQPWSGATQMIDVAFVQNATRALPSPIYYVSGPPGLVEAMRNTLEAAGVDEDDVRSEEFFGY